VRVTDRVERIRSSENDLDITKVRMFRLSGWLSLMRWTAMTRPFVQVGAMCAYEMQGEKVVSAGGLEQGLL
jgi:hypothetical protein